MVEPFFESTFGPRVGHGVLSTWTTPARSVLEGAAMIASRRRRSRSREIRQTADRGSRLVGSVRRRYSAGQITSGLKAGNSRDPVAP
jgi:hypothetical protein